MIQATIENKYCFNMRVSAAPMASTKGSGVIEPEAGRRFFLLSDSMA